MELLNSHSLDVRLGDTFTRVGTTIGHKYIDLKKKNSVWNDTFKAQNIALMPGEFILGTLVEQFDVPSNIAITLRGRSSVGRVGLDNSSFAGFIDGGFKGFLTIELANHSQNVIRLDAGDVIGQLVFERTKKPRQDYRQRDKSKYVDQGPAQGSLGIG